MSGKITAFSHPAAEQLRAFQAGTLPEEHLAEVEAHLQSCVACCDVLSGLPEDGFLLRVRCACGNPPARLQQRPSSTPPPPDTVTMPDTPLETTASATPSLPGYEHVRELGRGGMGVVYAATHGVMGRRVAIKLIHPEFSCNPVAVERFRREVLAAARLSHPNIVTAYDAGEDGGRSFLVMEHMDGENLGDRLNRLGPLPLAEACDAVRQAALGVQHAHDHGLIHRDLKPHNLIRTADGTVKVCDFGLASLLNDHRQASRTTAPNAIMGTPDYMAPEQAEDARAADGRADVYGLGCTLYHLLTGRVPFPEESVLLKLVAHRTQTRPAAGRLRPEIPAELDEVLRRAMARKPASRYQTPGDFAKALEPFADPAQSSPRRQGRKRVLALTALILSLAVGIVGVVRLPTGKDQDVVIQTDDSEVEVVVKGDRIVRIVDPKTGKAYQLDRDDLTLGFADDPGGLAVTLDGDKPIVLKRRGQTIATVRLDRHQGDSVGDSLQPDKGKPERLPAVAQMYWLDGYDDAVWGVAFSPDGRYTLTTGQRNNLHERASRRLVRRIGAGIWFAAFSPDGKRTLTSDLTMRSVIVSETETGREIRRFGVTGFRGRVADGAFSPDGNVIAVSEWDTVRVYDAATGKPGMTAPTHHDCRTKFAFTADGRRLLIIHSDARSIRTYEVASGKEIEPALLSPHPLVALTVSPDGKTVLGARWERNTDDVFVWDAASGKLLRRLSAGQKLSDFNHRQVAFLPDGQRALVTNVEGTMILWDIVTGRQVRRWDDLGGIVSLAVSADGAWALCGLLERRAFLLRLSAAPEPEQPGEVLRWLQGNKDVRRIAVSPDGRFAWTAGDDFSKWDLGTGERLQQIDARNFAEEALPSPDGKMLLFAAGGGGGAQLYDAATLKPLRPLIGSPPRLMQSVWLPDGRLLTGGNDFIARLWDARTGKVIRELRGHTADVDYVDVNRDGTRILTFSCREGTVRVWNPDDGKEVWRLSGQSGLALFAPDGKSILIGGSDGVIRRVAYPSGTILRSFRSPDRQLVGWDRLCLLPGGRHFLAAGSDRALRLWELETGRELYRANHPGLAIAIAVTPDGRHALLGTDFGYILKWRLPSLRRGGEEITEKSGRAEEADEVRLLGGGVGKIGRVYFLPDGERVLASGDSLSLWNIRTGEKIRQFTENPGRWPFAVNVSRDGRYALVGFNLVDLKTGAKVRTLEGVEDSGIHLWGVAFSPDGSRAVLGGEVGRRTGTLWVADLKTGKPWKIYDTEQGARAVAYSPDGTCIAAGYAAQDPTSTSVPCTLRIYKVETGKILHSFKAPNDAGCIAFSPDGKHLVSAHDKILYLWDLKTGKELKRFKGHTGIIEAVVFTPDGQHILSAGWDAAVRMWNLPRGQEVACLRGHQDSSLGLSVAPDGRHVVTGCYGDGLLRVWRLTK